MMRRVSQDGCMDISYEQSTIIQIGNIVAAYSSGIAQQVIGEYSTEEKAGKVMKLLHEAYQSVKTEELYLNETGEYKPIFQFPQEEEVTR